MKKSGFSVPSLAEIREANRIQGDRKPSLFEPSRTGPIPPQPEATPSFEKVRDPAAVSTGLASSHEDTATAASHRPDAIVANGLQVS